MQSTQSTHIEDILGPAASRYFAAGYRDVLHQVENVEKHTREETQHITAQASLRYPEGWSRNEDGTVRLPHLSSVDAVLLPLLTLQQSEPTRSLSDYWVEEIQLKAGSEPWWNLDVVPIEIDVRDAIDRITLTAVVGTIRSTILLRRLEPGAEPTQTAAPAEAGSVYSSAFRQVHCTTEPIEYDQAHLAMRATHQFTLGTNQAAEPNGVDSNYWPATTIVDYLVTMGQMVQALVYSVNHTDRQHMGNLWMRTMRITRTQPPTPLPVSSMTTTSVVRNRLLERGTARIHDMTVASVSSCGVEAEATVAYTEAADL